MEPALCLLTYLLALLWVRIYVYLWNRGAEPGTEIDPRREYLRSTLIFVMVCFTLWILPTLLENLLKVR